MTNFAIGRRRFGARLARAAAAVTVVAAWGALGAGPALAETVKIGVPIPVTGPFSSDGEVMEAGLKLAVEHLNAEGGLLGQQLEMRVFDIGDLTPDKLQAAAANLVDKEQVDVLINGYGGMGPDIPAFCSYALPYIHNDATSNVVELRNSMDCGNIFMGADRDYNYGQVTFEQITAMGYEFPSKRLAILHGPFDWELNVADGVADLAKEAGWEVVLTEEVPFGTKQWSGIVSKLRDAEPSLVYMELLDPAAVNTFITQFVSNPPENALLYVGYTVSVPAFGEVAKAGLADGVLGMTLSAHRPDPKGEEFVRMWREAYGEDPPFSIAAQIYDEMMMWADAVNAVGAFDDYEAIGNHLLETPYDGISGRFVFNDEQYVYTADDTVPTHLLQVQGSNIVQLMIGTEQHAAFTPPPWLK